MIANDSTQSRANDEDLRAMRLQLARFLDDNDAATTSGWTELCRILDLPLLALPEAAGGIAGLEGLLLAADEFGKRLMPSDFLSTGVLSLPMLLAAPDGSVAEALSLARSGHRYALAWLADPSSWLTSAPPALNLSIDTGVIDGTARFVVGAVGADSFIVLARDVDEVVMCRVDAQATGLRCEPRSGFDPTMNIGDVAFDRVRPAHRCAAPPRATRDQVLSDAMLYVAAEAASGTRRLCDLVVDHVLQRTQFGRPLGSFQAIKHSCADLFVQAESASQLVRWAAHAPDDEQLAARAAAKHYACDGFVRAARHTIQLLGAIGYCWEHPAHRFLRRALTLRELLGSRRELREILLADNTDREGA